MDGWTQGQGTYHSILWQKASLCYEMAHIAHLLYKFTFIEAFPQQLFLNDTSIGSIRISNLFLHTEHKQHHHQLGNTVQYYV